MKRKHAPNNIHEVQRPNKSDESNQCSFSVQKKAGSIDDKSLISFTVIGFANPTISADTCAVKICNVGNFRNQLPFYIKTYIYFPTNS
jgi:hypothetical protein